MLQQKTLVRVRSNSHSMTEEHKVFIVGGRVFTNTLRRRIYSTNTFECILNHSLKELLVEEFHLPTHFCSLQEVSSFKVFLGTLIALIISFKCRKNVYLTLNDV